jgi:hypothetical protein
MMEVEHDFPRREGFFFDLNSFRLDLYRLITCFYSSVTFAERGEDLDYDPVRDLQGEFEEFEITRLLVNIAAITRVMDERGNCLSERFGLECGVLIEDLTEPEEIILLNLREACNKIIHAEKLNWDVEQLKNEGNLPYPTSHFITPCIYLYGSKRKKKWKATLDIAKFVKHNATLWNG